MKTRLFWLTATLVLSAVCLFACAQGELPEDTDGKTENDTKTEETEMTSNPTAGMPPEARAEAVSEAHALYGELFKTKAAKSYKEANESNPLITQRFGADPYAMEYGGRVYVYTTHDEYEYDANGNISQNTYGKVNTLNCYSSADLVNWTDHGVINVADGRKKICKWASNSWAPAACHREIDGEEKFFLYFANSAGGIGVMTSDSPTGPWTDPIGKELVTKSTPGCSGVVWMFDPAVFIDDDGQAYLYFGGGIPNDNYAHPKTARVIKLGDDMISVQGKAETIDAPFFFEDSGINKIDGKYIYSYCLNWSDDATEKNPAAANIGIMESDSPMGPFEYKGTVMKNPGNYFGLYGNNHHCMIEFKGEYYMFYHTQLLDKLINGETKDYRATFINKVSVKNGEIKDIKMSKKGVNQVEALDAYASVIEAETIAASGGVNTKSVTEKSSVFAANMVLCEIDAGDWTMLRGVDFGDVGAGALTVKYSSEAETSVIIKVTRDALDGEAIAYVELAPTGGKFAEITVPVSGAVGECDVYFMFSGAGAEIDFWQFTAAEK